MNIYPMWKYHRTKEAIIVRSEEQMIALGEGWEDTPAAFERPESYKEHMASWEFKEEKAEQPKKKPGRPKAVK